MKLRIFLATAGVLAIILLGQDIPLASYLRSSERDRVHASVERDAFILAGTANEVLETTPPDPDAVARLTTTLVAYATRSNGKVIVAGNDGVAVAASDPSDVGRDFSTRPEVITALDGRPFDGTRASVTAGTELFFVSVPVLNEARVRGVVRVSFARSVIDARVRPAVRGLVAVFLISMVAALLAALLVARQLGRPLRRLLQSTERIAGGDFSSPADTRSGPKEIRQLAAGFNAMTARIDDLVTRQRRFAGDASHQLRSPLTALRLQLEQAAASADPQSVSRQLDAAVGETERLQRLIDGLLFLSRTPADEVPTEPIDVSALVGERVATWSAMGAERDVELRTAALPVGLLARAAPGAAEQILDNYLDNALSVSAANSVIEVRVARDGDTVVVDVIDEGPGMPDDHLQRAFDRFWRAPDAPHIGSGLGLAIVHQLAMASGGSVALRNRADRPGLIATVRLPAHTRASA